MPCRGTTKRGCVCRKHPLANGLCKLHQSQAASHPNILKRFGTRACEMFFCFVFSKLLPHFGFLPMFSWVPRITLVWISMQLIVNYVRGARTQSIVSIIGWALISASVAFMILILLLLWGGASFILWWHEPGMVDKWWDDIKRSATSRQILARCSTAKPFACPKDELGSSFLDLNEIEFLVDYIASDRMEDMLQFRGGLKMGKTSSIQQALCFKSEWMCKAVYVSLRSKETGARIESFDDLCAVFETATAKLAPFIEKPPDHKKGEDRFRRILNNLVKFQAKVDTRIVVLDDLDAIKSMGADYNGALILIKETLAEMRADYATKVLVATSDSSFAIKIDNILGDRFITTTMNREVPVEECAKTDGVPVDEDLIDALSRTGRELPTCLAFRGGHATVQVTEQSLIHKAIESVVQHPEACLPLLGWSVSQALWLELLDANLAKSELNGSSNAVMRPIYQHPSVVEHCRQSGAALKRSKEAVEVWVRKNSGEGSAFRLKIDVPFLDSLKKAMKAELPNTCAHVDADDITILDPDTKKPVDDPDQLLRASSGITPYLFELPTK